MRLLVVAASVAVVSGCVAPSVLVLPSGAKQAARRADCNVAFYRVKPPERPFDEIAVLQYEGARVGMLQLQELMRKQACAAGGDAVVVTREYTAVGGWATMVATAIRYRDLTPLERAALDQPRDLTTEQPPPGYRLAVLKQATPVHPDPLMKKPATSTLPEGAIVWAPEPVKEKYPPSYWSLAGPESGTEVRLPDGSTGFVSPEVLAPYEAPAAKPQEQGVKLDTSEKAI